MKILLTEAAIRCGYKRANTMREKHLATEAQKAAMGHEYDEFGRVLVDADATDELAASLKQTRTDRGEWRSENLGRYAKKGGGRRKPAPPRAQGARKRRATQTPVTEVT